MPVSRDSRVIATVLGLPARGLLGLIRLYQVTRAHVYLTYPFILSWSMLEAMAAGLPTIASDVGAIPEVLIPQKHGFIHFRQRRI